MTLRAGGSIAIGLCSAVLFVAVCFVAAPVGAQTASPQYPPRYPPQTNPQATTPRNGAAGQAGNPNWQQGAPVQRTAAPNGVAAGAQQGRQVQPGQNQIQPGQIQSTAAMPLVQPFALTPQQQAELDKLLTDWQAQSDKVKLFSCTFDRMEFNPALTQGNANQYASTCSGEIKYSAPDKGSFKVREAFTYVPDPKTNQFKQVKSDDTEWWTCDGKSIFQVNNAQKTVEERILPPELQGRAIADGPLPFVFGANRNVLERRYYMRVITPSERLKTEVWVEAYPKLQADAMNFSKVTVVLSKTKMQPIAIQIENPGAGGNQARTVIALKEDSMSINNPWAQFQQMLSDFSRPSPLGYKHVVINPPGAVGAPNPPGGGAAPQAGGVKQASNLTPINPPLIKQAPANMGQVDTAGRTQPAQR